MQLRKAICAECEKHLQYMESHPIKQMGVTMHTGEHFCTGGKRARRFMRGDPKVYVPDWCPKRKTPICIFSCWNIIIFHFENVL